MDFSSILDTLGIGQANAAPAPASQPDQPPLDDLMLRQKIAERMREAIARGVGGDQTQQPANIQALMPKAPDSPSQDVIRMRDAGAPVPSQPGFDRTLPPAPIGNWQTSVENTPRPAPAPMPAPQVAPSNSTSAFTGPAVPQGANVEMGRLAPQGAAPQPQSQGSAPNGPPQGNAAPGATSGATQQQINVPSRFSELSPIEAFGSIFGNKPFGAAQRERAWQSDTYKALRLKGYSDSDASALVGNPAVLAQMAPTIFGPKSTTTHEIEGPYGKMLLEKGSDGQWRYVQPVGSPQGGQAPMAPQPAAAPAQTPQAVPNPFGAAPGGAQPAATQGAQPLPLAQPGAQQPLGTQQTNAQQGATIPPGQHVGPAIHKNYMPEGAIQKMAPDGSGFLYDQNNQPVFESKAEADARGKLYEKRADTQATAEEQAGGIGSLIQDARNIAKQPGFMSALAANRKDTGGIHLPFGMGEVNPSDIGRYVAKNADPNNPMWGAMGDIDAVQKRLELLVARPLMKGQGSITDSERAMITKSIGDLRNASNPADYQFKLNGVERMLTAMNARREGDTTPLPSESAIRPSQAEVNDAMNLSTKGDIEARVNALAKKYNVDPYDMIQYLATAYSSQRR